MAAHTSIHGPGARMLAPRPERSFPAFDRNADISAASLVHFFHPESTLRSTGLE